MGERLEENCVGYRLTYLSTTYLNVLFSNSIAAAGLELGDCWEFKQL